MLKFLKICSFTLHKCMCGTLLSVISFSYLKSFLSFYFNFTLTIDNNSEFYYFTNSYNLYHQITTQSTIYISCQHKNIFPLYNYSTTKIKIN